MSSVHSRCMFKWLTQPACNPTLPTNCVQISQHDTLTVGCSQQCAQQCPQKHSSLDYNGFIFSRWHTYCVCIWGQDTAKYCGMQLEVHSSTPSGSISVMLYQFNFPPDGTQIMTRCNDNTNVQLWDAASSALLKSLKGHSWGIISIIFSPDGSQIVSESKDSMLWLSVSGMHLNTFKCHSSWVMSIAFSSDSPHLVSGLVLSQPALACFQLFCSKECSTECNYVGKGDKYSSIVYLSNEKKNHLNTCSQSWDN